MIIIQEKDLIAVSGPRACYLHPEDSTKVIKIVRKKVFLRKNNANWQEWCHYHYLLKRHGKLDIVNECFGFIQTNLGEGLVWQCVRDVDGDISSTVTNIMKMPENYDLIAVKKELNRFCQFLIQKNIQLFDLNPMNVIIKINADGICEAVSADIKGRYANHEFVPLSTYIPFFSRRKLIRRCKELTDSFSDYLKTSGKISCL
jgi:hypothetical protein